MIYTAEDFDAGLKEAHRLTDEDDPDAFALLAEDIVRLNIQILEQRALILKLEAQLELNKLANDQRDAEIAKVIEETCE